jgi:hypothetical protein
MNERISLFDLTTLPFELCLHKRRLENQKTCEFCKRRFLKKRTDHPPWKVPLFIGHGFSRQRDNKPHFKFNTKKVVLHIYQMMLRMLGFGRWITDFGAAGISRCFRTLCRVQRTVRHRNTSSLISFKRYAYSLGPCEIWRWVIHFGLEKQDNSS